MKRVFALILAAVMLLALVGCSQETGQEPTGTNGPAAQDPTGSTEATVDDPAADRKEIEVLTTVTATNPDGSKPYEYQWKSLDGRTLSSMTTKTGDTSVSVSFAYREGDRKASATGLSSGVTITFGWDEKGRITSVLETSTGGSYGVDYVYDENGRCVERSVTRNEAPASKTQYTFNADGNVLTERTLLPDGSVSNSRTYTYNDNGDLTEESTQWTGSEPVVKKYTYTYDDNGRAVTKITLDAEDSQTAQNQYSYDSEGRLVLDVAWQGDEQPVRTEYAYGENGLLAKETIYLIGNKVDHTVDYTYMTMRMTDAEYALYSALMDYSQNWY